jgi:hypothetical protein
MQSIDLKFFAELEVYVDPPQEIGDTGSGKRRVIPITGGKVSGENWSGSVLNGGADFQLIVNERRAELDARYVLQLPQGRIYIQNRAVRVADPAVTQKLIAGEVVDPSEVYFRCTPVMETSIPELKWIEERIFIGSGIRKPDCVVLTFYEVL